MQKWGKAGVWNPRSAAWVQVLRTVYVRTVVEREGVIKSLTVRNLMSPGAESLFGNYEGCCGEGFWLWPRRRGRSIPAAGCDDRTNAGHGQKTRRPEGFRGKGRLASPCSRRLSELLRGGRAQRLLRRACHPAFSPKTAPLVVSKQALSGTGAARNSFFAWHHRRR